MIKKRRFKLLTLLLSFLLLVGCSSDTISYKDDFYESVNEKWLSEAKIPDDKSSIDGFEIIGESVKNTLKTDFDSISKENKETDIPEMVEFFKFYKLANDYERRNLEGVEPLIPTIEEIENLNSLDDLNNSLAEFELKGLTLPFTLGINADFKDANLKAIYIQPAALFLSDESDYGEDKSPETQEFLKNYKSMLQSMLVMTGKNEEDAANIVDEALEFDATMAKYIDFEKLDTNNISDIYNPESIDVYSKYSSYLKFDMMFDSLVGKAPDYIINYLPEFFHEFDKIINPENFNKLKSWMIIKTLENATPFLSEEFEEVGSKMDMLESGIKELSPSDQRAFDLSLSQFNDLAGIYYGRTYLGEESKKDIETMVQNFIEVYKNRIANIDWLTESTKESAIKKLNTMVVQIGYPEEIPEIYSKIIIDTDKSCYENIQSITKLSQELDYSKFYTPIDRSLWEMAAYEVNAYYSPQTNSITFPAAILSAPFYSAEQSDSENYGAVGTVIAHEISHAFDPNGSKFDENGNMVSWWTEEDFTEYEKKTAEMVKLFDGIEIYGGKVDGEQTLGENVADAGGLAVALEALKTLPDANLEEFFTSWATIWRSKSTPEYESQLLNEDVHAPNKLRCNIQLSNTDDFYEVFDIVEGDGMYIPPENRVTIW